jgi:hypothetical protein
LRIIDGHNQIVAVRNACDRASWSGARMMSAALLGVDMLLCELWNRAEAVYTTRWGLPFSPPEESGQEAGGEVSPESDPALAALNGTKEGE